MGDMAPERDLIRLLGSIAPRLHSGVFVFCELPEGLSPQAVDAQLVFHEDEATTVVITEERASTLGLAGEAPSAWITIGASSALEAIGFLSVITARLAGAGISVNVVSACRHDHLFVPFVEAEVAMAALAELQALHRTSKLASTGAAAKHEFAVRPALLSDAEPLGSLWSKSGLHFERTRLAGELESCLQLHGALVLVATEGEAIVGSIWASYDGRRGWLQRLATDPTRRGRGIARALVAEAERRLALLGAEKVNLLIEPDNAGVTGFYEELGYERDELIFMERRLDAAMGG
jgi:hypothetical protein